MDSATVHFARTAAPSGLEAIGRVVAVTGAQATIELSACSNSGETTTVGKFMGLITGKSVIVGLITEVGEQFLAGPSSRNVARLDLIGEIKSGEAVVLATRH